jgi:hypothetical protein
MAEMTPPQVRGTVVSAKETVIVGGIVAGYAAGNFTSGDPQAWAGECRTCQKLLSPHESVSQHQHDLTCFLFASTALSRLVRNYCFRYNSNVNLDLSDSKK